MTNRRDFLKHFATVTAGATALPAVALTVSKNDHLGNLALLNDGPRFAEPRRDLPVANDCDVIVVGGGPAGVAAAVSAARAGAKVRLFELQGSLGGIWTSGLLTYIFDFDKCDMGMEIIRRLNDLHAKRCVQDRDFVYEPEYMKFVCEELCAEAGVEFLLQTPVVAAYRDASGHNTETIITESKSGRQAWRAKAFIDCSGDGDLAALAGCGFDMGCTPEGWGQPATLNVDGKAHGHWPAFGNFKKELDRAGFETSYGNPTLFRIHENLLLLMINHEYKLRVDDAKALTQATVRARKELFHAVNALEKLGGPWEGVRLAATAEQIGNREARRIHGRYTLTKEDVANGAIFDDAVTTSRFPIDIHAIDRETNRKSAIEHGAFKPFQIPLRSLRALDADNLYMAGRCISGDFVAHASYRVTGSAVAMGEAVGRHVASLVK